jgi:hypothetical protein
MSRAILDILKQIRNGNSSLCEEEVTAVEPHLAIIDDLLSSGSIQEQQLLRVIEELKKYSQSLGEGLQPQQQADISTRMSNVKAWELAVLVGMACTHHVFTTSKAKQAASRSCVDMYISVVDFLLAHREARCRAHAASLVRAVSSSFASSSRRCAACAVPSHDNDESESESKSESVLVYERLYAVIMRHVQQHLVTREVETRPVLLQGAGWGGCAPQEDLALDDLR